ncbi:hypothetical protein TSUD_114640 [Trifolium subterraneum]|uniref:galactinol--sucrose galactosyltransferase n=1 Tax=Trifolium subterraneum TaxID=3900 RepID=A0A2Z6MQ80_TRISU|nr:hypothetical protein TSUD_114640 [Trifolium subterraneum]
MSPPYPTLNSTKNNSNNITPTTKQVNPISDSSFTFTLFESTLKVNDHVILSDVPKNITITTTPSTTTATNGCFLGFKATEPKSRHVTPIGELKNINFTSIFRFKVWWTTLWTGSNGRDLETETQFLMLQNSDQNSGSDQTSGRPYVLFLPIIEGQFRASLQPGENDNISICVESSSTSVTNSQYNSVVYIHADNDPFKLVKEAMKTVRAHLGTFKLLEEKTVPGIAEKFGWCTWDAFYLKVHPQGIWEGVQNLTNGGCPPGFVLIDDGWQSIAHDDDPIDTNDGINRTDAGEQMPCRLIKFEENYKFKDYKNGLGLGGFIKELKKGFESVEYVYVWHALCGYWGGIRPGVEGVPEATVEKPKLTVGLETTMEDLAVDKIVNNGVGLVPPHLVDQMYEGIHSHLEDSGIDGVKVDVIHLLEMVCEKYGGRVDLAKAYYKALTTSVKKHFNGNGVIASMEHCNDFMLLGTEAISLGRVGDDFWCTDPYGDPNGTYWLQGCHMVHCAYNSLWMGNFIQPDWDMFQSTHPCAAFHAASRAISGGPIYISDTVGNHNFDLLKKLALPDDIEWNSGKNPISIESVQLFALYFSQAKKLKLFSPSDTEEISLEPFNFELITVSPITLFPKKSFKFAPIGLVNMLNNGGAIQSFEYDEAQDLVQVGVKGAGEMRVFASKKPKSCRIDGKEVDFEYEDFMVVNQVPWPSSSKFSSIQYIF